MRLCWTTWSRTAGSAGQRGDCAFRWHAAAPIEARLITDSFQEAMNGQDKFVPGNRCASRETSMSMYAPSPPSAPRSGGCHCALGAGPVSSRYLVRNLVTAIDVCLEVSALHRPEGAPSPAIQLAGGQG